MGRWSRLIASKFLEWAAPPQDAAWLEIGCGTGALTSTILADCAPKSILAIDPSAGFIAHARSEIGDDRARFEVADASKLDLPDAAVDIVTSGLVVNFLPDRLAALIEMRRVLKPDGLLCFYVWDYPGGGIGFIDAFWKAATQVDKQAAALDEGGRFPFCTRDGLAALCAAAGFSGVAVEPIEIETSFPDFEAFWQPFTLGAGPAPGYCSSLSEDHRAALKTRLAETLGTEGVIRLPARAWAVKAQNA
jgi:SAM-dependent methyltransferase